MTSNHRRSLGLVPQLAALAFALLLLGLRLPHLAGPIDDPSSRRQLDTAFLSREFFRHGVDLLHPSVAWMGPYRTMILDFPVTEAVISLLYRAFGPDVLWDRVTALALFALAALYLHLLVRRLCGDRVAWLATLLYLSLPLGQFYSRTAHVDFGATALVHAMLFHGWIAIAGSSWRHAVVAALAGSLAAAIKAPYVFPITIVLAFAAWTSRARGAPARALLVLGLPLAAFTVWWRHVELVNGAAPDWWFLPGYHRGALPPGWTFGTIAERLEADRWVQLGRRLLLEVASPVVAGLALLGLAWRDRDARPGRPGARSLASAWTFGALAYLALFFRLNWIHGYYQIPLLAPLALLGALGIDRLWIGRGRFAPLIAAIALVAAIGVALAMPARLGWYRVDWLRVAAAEEIRTLVPEGALLVASDGDSEFSDPRLLVRADRVGWAVGLRDLTPDLIWRFQELGAGWLAVVVDAAHPDQTQPLFLELALVVEYPIVHDGRALGTLYVYDLGRIGRTP